jgi:hypothetical protein
MLLHIKSHVKLFLEWFYELIPMWKEITVAYFNTLVQTTVKADLQRPWKTSGFIASFRNEIRTCDPHEQETTVK